MRWAIVALGAACSPPTPACNRVEDSCDLLLDSDDVTVVEGAVAVGTGELQFEALAEGGDIAVVHGPQGGYHLVGSVRTRGVEAGDRDSLSAPENPTVTFAAVVDGVNLTLTGSYRQGLDAVEGDPDGWTHEMVGRLCILDITDDDEVDGATVVFSVQVDEASGETYRDERTLTIFKDPRNL